MLAKAGPRSHADPARPGVWFPRRPGRPGHTPGGIRGRSVFGAKALRALPARWWEAILPRCWNPANPISAVAEALTGRRVHGVPELSRLGDSGQSP